ncbi:MAG TPA: hypothetical protein VLI92_00140, partial [Candidatus Saccharimonadales bacterium]|nr:hypothetical protein [Candidatus Saccharimonadales bacterium]
MKNSIKSITPDKKFFTNKGKSIRQLEQTNTISIYKNYSSHFFKKDDKISTLFEEPQLEELSSLANVIPTKRQVIINSFTTFTSNHKKASSSLMLSLIPLTLFIFFSIPAFTFSRPHAKYSVFSSKPLTVGGIAEQVATGDPRAVKLDGVFTEYGCPNFEGLGANFVAEADKNKIPYWLIPAVSFQESDCGNITPKKD